MEPSYFPIGKNYGPLANFGKELFYLLLQGYQQTKLCRLAFNCETFPLTRFPDLEKQGHLK